MAEDSLCHSVGKAVQRTITNWRQVWLQTLLDTLRRRKFTMGRTPVSFGKSLTKENPSLRCRRISSASLCQISLHDTVQVSDSQ